MNILLVGEDAAGMQMLQHLRRTSHRIAGVMASPSRQNRAGASVWSLASKLGYSTWPSKLVKDPDFAAVIVEEKVDILLNVHSLFLIHQDVVTAPGLGSYNLHPGPLPRYAGLNSASWAIYKGEARHGVTLHKMEPGIDTGNIVYQAMIAVGADETGLSLTTKCIDAGIPLVLRLLEVAAEDPSLIPSIAQDLTKREYFGREIPEGGRLSWESPARRVVDFVRACDYLPFPSPWGHPRTSLDGRAIGIAKAQLTGIPGRRAPRHDRRRRRIRRRSGLWGRVDSGPRGLRGRGIPPRRGGAENRKPAAGRRGGPDTPGGHPAAAPVPENQLAPPDAFHRAHRILEEATGRPPAGTRMAQRSRTRSGFVGSQGHTRSGCRGNSGNNGDAGRGGSGSWCTVLAAGVASRARALHRSGRHSAGRLRRWPARPASGWISPVTRHFASCFGGPGKPSPRRWPMPCRCSSSRPSCGRLSEPSRHPFFQIAVALQPFSRGER